MPKQHNRCTAGLELAFSVAGPIEDRDISDKRARSSHFDTAEKFEKNGLPKLHNRCSAGLEFAFSVAVPFEDRDAQHCLSQAIQNKRGVMQCATLCFSRQGAS